MTTDKVKPSPAARARRSESTSHDDGSNKSASPAASPAKEEGVHSEHSEGAVSDDNPPLPDEPVPDAADDGWDARWDNHAGAYYFYNSRTGVSQWQNPRVPEPTTSYASYDRFANKCRLMSPSRI